MEHNSLTQHIHSPTRGSNTLDLVITRNPDTIHSYKTLDTLISDQKIITVNAFSSMREHSEFPSPPLRTQANINLLNFFRDTINWEEIRQNWEDIRHRMSTRRCYWKIKERKK